MAVLLSLGATLACHKGSTPTKIDKPIAPVKAPVSPAAPSKVLIEPQAATLVTGGTLTFTSVLVKEGDKTRPLHPLDPQNPGGSAMVSGIEAHRMAGAGSNWFYKAPAAPGIHTGVIALGGNHSVKKTVEFSVVHVPPGAPAFLEQRSVTVSAGSAAIFTMKEAPLPAGTAAHPARTYQLALVEPQGGTLVVDTVATASTLKKGRYTAPATPGTYHVKLTAVGDPTVDDTVEVKVVAPEA
jgi:hypothetical protein